MSSDYTRTEVPSRTNRRLMSVASIVPEVYPSDGRPTESDTAAASELNRKVPGEAEGVNLKCRPVAAGKLNCLAGSRLRPLEFGVAHGLREGEAR